MSLTARSWRRPCLTDSTRESCRFLFEFLFLLRKWGLMIAGLAFVDSFWTLLVAVANYCVLWAAAIRVKPFATQSGQFHFRTAQGLTLLMMVGRCPPACHIGLR